jgi:hypothetical protein
MREMTRHSGRRYTEYFWTKVHHLGFIQLLSDCLYLVVFTTRQCGNGLFDCKII